MTKKIRRIRRNWLGLYFSLNSLAILTIVASLWMFGEIRIFKRCQIEPNNCPNQGLIIAVSVIGTAMATVTAFLSWVYLTGIEVIADDSKSDREILDELDRQAMADELVKIMRRFDND